jgi:hypothetical protein
VPGNPNEGGGNPDFAGLPPISASSPTALMSYAGGVVTNLCMANIHGDCLYNHDGNGNYIIKPVPMTNEHVLGTSYSPYKLLQATTDLYVGWTTGQGYKSIITSQESDTETDTESESKKSS